MNGRCPGRVVRRSDYLENYHNLTRKDGVPFVPYRLERPGLLRAILLSIAACAVYSTFRAEWATRSTINQTGSTPRLLLLVLYAVLSLLPPSLENPRFADRTRCRLDCLVALPLVSEKAQKSWKRRPIAVLTILLVAVALGTFTHLASHARESVMDVE